MKNNDRSSSYYNNHSWQSNTCFYKRLGYNIETCYHRNKSVVSVFVSTIANTESIQPMALLSTQSKSSGSTITIFTVDLQNIIANTIRMIDNVSYSSSLLVLYGILLPLGLWILLMATTWHLAHPYFLNLILHHTFLIFAQLVVL